jgi:hypothetical protein
MVSMPCGITNSIMTNVGAVLITKFVKKIKFYSRHKQLHATVFAVFIMSYINAGLLPLKRLPEAKWMPPDFTPNWVLFYSKMIMTSMILSNVMPYLGPSLKVLFKRGCCCCKRKNYEPKTHLNPEFPLERRYASILTTVFVVMTYGVAMPALFIIASVIFIFQSIMDKLLITYFYKERVEHNDLLNRSSLKVMKYSIVLFLVIGGLAMGSNYCTLFNESPSIHFTNENLACIRFWAGPQMLMYAGFLFLCFFLTFDLMTKNRVQEKFE